MRATGKLCGGRHIGLCYDRWIMVRFERGSEHREADVVISIIEQATDKVLARATLTGWRWDRAIAAVAPRPEAPSVTGPWGGLWTDNDPEAPRARDQEEGRS